MLPINGRVFCINTKKLIRLSSQDEFNQGKRSWMRLRRLVLKPAMDLPFTCHPWELSYAQM